MYMYVTVHVFDVFRLLIRLFGLERVKTCYQMDMIFILILYVICIKRDQHCLILKVNLINIHRNNSYEYIIKLAVDNVLQRVKTLISLSQEWEQKIKSALKEKYVY